MPWFSVIARMAEEDRRADAVRNEQQRLYNSNVNMDGALMSYHNILYKLKSVVPRGWSVILLDETSDDVACDWRTYRVCYKSKYHDMKFPKYSTGNDILLHVEDLKNIWSNDDLKLEKKEVKMTREEAIRIVNEVCAKYEQTGTRYLSGDRTVELFESLGLIKFDEPEKFIKFECKVGDRVVITLKMSNDLLHRYEGHIEDIRKPVI